MDPFTIIAILGPIVLKIIDLIEKSAGKKKGPAKRKAALSLIMDAWQTGIDSGTIKGPVAMLSPFLVKRIAGMVIDGGVGIVNRIAKA